MPCAGVRREFAARTRRRSSRPATRERCATHQVKVRTALGRRGELAGRRQASSPRCAHRAARRVGGRPGGPRDALGERDAGTVRCRRERSAPGEAHLGRARHNVRCTRQAMAGLRMLRMRFYLTRLQVSFKRYAARRRLDRYVEICAEGLCRWSSRVLGSYSPAAFAVGRSKIGAPRIRCGSAPSAADAVHGRGAAGVVSPVRASFRAAHRERAGPTSGRIGRAGSRENVLSS